jgi:hypothetical protein
LPKRRTCCANKFNRNKNAQRHMTESGNPANLYDCFQVDVRGNVTETALGRSLGCDDTDDRFADGATGKCN